MAREQMNLPPELAHVSPAALEAVLLLLKAQQEEQEDRQTGILLPTQIRGVKKNYQYKYREYPKALTAPGVEVKDASAERLLRTKWNMPLPWDLRDPLNRQFVDDYYTLAEYPKRMTPPQIVVQDANEEATVRAEWQAKFGIGGSVKLYPTWKFHVSKGAVSVADAKAEELLGPGWYDTAEEMLAAAKGEPAAPKPLPEEEERAKLTALAAELGIKIDAREKTPTIRGKVARAQEKAADALVKELAEEI